MDFSAAQRAAHAEEYAELIIFLNESFHKLTRQSQAIERKQYIEEAKEAEVGCDVHFGRSAIRVKKNGALVPPESVDAFDDGIRRLLSPSTTSTQFSEVVTSLKSQFPRINGWLNWWLRPTVASMIFPARSVVDPVVAASVPSTSNPVEHQHSLLHHATGIDQDLIPGIEKLFLHVQELEAQYNAIEGLFIRLLATSLVNRQFL